MASKNAPLSLPETDESLTMPDEFVSDSGTAAQSNSVNLRETGFDDARDEIEKRKLTPPAGDYIKEESWDLSEEKNTSVIEGDCEPGDLNPLGRTMYLLYGYPTTREDKSHNEYTPFLRVRMSPDRRMHKVKENEVDFAYKMFLSGKDVFVAINGGRPKTQWEFLECLANESYAINCSNGDDGLFVLKLKPLKKQRP